MQGITNDGTTVTRPTIFDSAAPIAVAASGATGVTITLLSGTDFDNTEPANPTYVLAGTVQANKQVTWTRNTGTCGTAGLC